MASPRITYQRQYVQDPDFATIRLAGQGNALIVPDTFLKARQKEAAEKARQDRGKLFTEWARNRIGINSNVLEPSAQRLGPLELQHLAHQSPIDQALISTICFTATQYAQPAHPEDWEMGFEVVHDRDNDPTFQPTEEEQAEIDMQCRAAEKLIMNVSKDYEQNFSYFMSAQLDDELTIDRKVMVKQLDGRKRPSGYYWLPGGSIRPTLKFIRPWMEEWGAKDASMWNPERAAERLTSRMYRDDVRDMNGNHIDLTTAKYVQVSTTNQDRVIAAFKEDEIHVDITRPYAAMNETMYGYSALEQSLPVTLLWMRAWKYQEQLFDTTWPEALLILYGDYDIEGLDSFKQTMLADNGNLHRLPIIAAGAQADNMQAQMLQTRKTPTEMLFADLLQFLINLKCAFYGIRPININMNSPNVDNTSRTDLNYEMPEVNDPGVRGRMRRLARNLTEEIIKPWYPKLRMRWVGMDMVPEQQRIERELGLMAVKTVDEIRASIGLAKLPPGLPGDNLGDQILSPTAIQAIGQILASKAQDSAGPPQNPSELSHPEGAPSGGDFGGNDNSMPGQQLAEGATPPTPTQGVPPAQPPSPAQPVQGAGQ